MSLPNLPRPAPRVLRLVVGLSLLAVTMHLAWGQSEAAGLTRQVAPLRHTPDVPRMCESDGVRAGIAQLTLLTPRRSALPLLLPTGDICAAPACDPPQPWLTTMRSRHLHGDVREAASRHTSIYLSLFRERDDRLLSRDPVLSEWRGPQPGDAGYWIRGAGPRERGDSPRLLSTAGVARDAATARGYRQEIR
jgi:hypothetical protein